MYDFIVNPNARSVLGQKVWKKLESVLVQKKISYRVHFTEFQKPPLTPMQRLCVRSLI